MDGQSVSENDYEQLSDEELAEMAKTEPAAATVLIARILPTIRAFSHSFSPQISEDLLQEGLLGALNGILCFDESRGRAKTYLVTCAKNHMLSAVKRNSLIGGTSDETEELADRSEEEFGGDSERVDMLYSAIENYLTNRERDVVSLYLLGLSYREISQRLGVTEKSVDNAMQRAKKKIKNGIM